MVLVLHLCGCEPGTEKKVTAPAAPPALWRDEGQDLWSRKVPGGTLYKSNNYLNTEVLTFAPDVPK